MITEVLEKSQTNNLIDLGFGSGGTWQSLLLKLRSKVLNIKVTFTDFYPNTKELNPKLKNLQKIEYLDTSVDAHKVPTELKGIRNLFLYFHHYVEKDANQIIKNTIDTKSGIAIFLGQERSVTSLLGMIF